MAAALLCASVGRAYAQQNATNNGFSLQVTPSTLVETIKPGENSVFELKVQNKNIVAETFKMELRAFSVEKETGKIQISEDKATNVADFVSFEQETFLIEAGEWFTQKVRVNTPADAGFSYNFVILISRKDPLQAVEGASSIEGSVAVFALLNTDRPDATKKLELESFLSVRKSYEYLPAEFEIRVKNSGNTIVQPQGNVFIGRGENEQQPLAVLKLNENNGYIIPDSSRMLTLVWNEGFPSRNENGKLTWDWSKLQKFRIGKYTAKAVLIYDDGERDVPIESVVTFWVIPWKLLLGLFLVLTLIFVGLFTVLRKSFGVIGKQKKSAQKPEV